MNWVTRLIEKENDYYFCYYDNFWIVFLYFIETFSNINTWQNFMYLKYKYQILLEHCILNTNTEYIYCNTCICNTCIWNMYFKFKYFKYSPTQAVGLWLVWGHWSEVIWLFKNMPQLATHVCTCIWAPHVSLLCHGWRIRYSPSISPIECRKLITNRQRFLTLSSLVEWLK